MYAITIYNISIEGLFSQGRPSPLLSYSMILYYNIQLSYIYYSPRFFFSPLRLWPSCYSWLVSPFRWLSAVLFQSSGDFCVFGRSLLGKTLLGKKPLLLGKTHGPLGKPILGKNSLEKPIAYLRKTCLEKPTILLGKNLLGKPVAV